MFMPTSTNGVNFFNPTEEDDDHPEQSSSDRKQQEANSIDLLESLKNCSLTEDDSLRRLT